MSPTKSEELYPIGASFSGHPIIGVQELLLFSSPETGVTSLKTRLFFPGHWPNEGILTIGLSGPETYLDINSLVKPDGTILEII